MSRSKRRARQLVATVLAGMACGAAAQSFTSAEYQLRDSTIGINATATESGNDSSNNVSLMTTLVSPLPVNGSGELSYETDFSASADAGPDEISLSVSATITTKLIGTTLLPGHSVGGSTARVRAEGSFTGTHTVTGSGQAGDPVLQPITLTLGASNASSLQEFFDPQIGAFLTSSISGNLDILDTSTFNDDSIRLTFHTFESDTFGQLMFPTTIGAELNYILSAGASALTFASVEGGGPTTVTNASSVSGTLSLSFAPAMLTPPNPFTWVNGSGGLFGNAQNWDPQGTPGADDHIVFDIVNDGYVVDMNADAAVASLRVIEGTVSLDFANNAGITIDVEGEVVVGESAGIRGGLDVIGGSMTAESVTVAAAAGADGLLTLREGAVLDFDTLTVGGTAGGAAQFYALSGASIAIGSGDVVDVIGAASEFGVEHLTVGEAGVGGGAFTVESGALATVDGSLVIANGDVVVTGSMGDTASTLAAATLRDAVFVEALGTLTVSDGGVVNIGDPFDNPFGDLVVDAASDEVDAEPVLVAGDGSELNIAGTLAVGVQASGQVAADTGGMITAHRIVLGSSASAGIDGELHVAGEGARATATRVEVGTAAAGAGRLRIEEGATVHVTRELHIENGEVLVTAPLTSSLLEDPAPNLFVATQDFGEILVGPEGRFNVTDGGRVQVGTSIFDISADFFVNADTPLEEAAPVTIAGEGASLLVFKRVAIGDIEDGRMTVSGGASLVANEITLGSGLLDGTFGRLDVTGPHSEVFTQSMTLGDESAGAGALSVQDGATVAIVDQLELIRSHVFVDGGFQDQDSSLYVGEANPNGGSILVREDSRFTVSAGAVVEVGNIGAVNGEVIVESTAPVGEPAPLFVTGEASRLQAFGSLVVGFTEAGSAAVDAGGKLTAAQVALGVAEDAAGGLVVGGAGSTLTTRVANVGSALGGTGILVVEDGGTAEILERLVVNENGTVQVTGEGSVVIGPGEITPVGGSVVIGPGGELWGTGMIFANRLNNGGVENYGTVYPGSSPGMLTIDGNYYQGETGVLVIEIGGTAAGAEYDVLNVAGDLTLEGKIVLEFIDGFAPSQGESFDFLVAAGVIDLARADFEIRKLAPDFVYDIVSVNGGIQLLSMSDATAVPLPPAGLLLLPALAVALRQRRREVPGTVHLSL